MQGYGNLAKAVGIPCKKCMEIRPSAWNSNQQKKTAIFELPYFAQESILVALKACGVDGP